MNMKAEVNGVSLNYRTDGDSGDWVVMSNSLASNHTMWDAEAEVLARDYRVLRYDTRGHGASGSTAAPYSLDLLIGDVAGLMDTVGIDSAHYVGLSLGGMTGLGFALKAPERFKTLTVCDARADAPAAFRDGWDDRIAIVLEKGIEPLVEPTIERWFTDAFRKTGAQVLDKVRAMIRETSVEGYIGCGRAIQNLGYLPRLGEIGLPTLFVAGAQDQATPPDAMRAMHEAVPGSGYALIDPAGHLSNLENPDPFMAAVGGFLKAN